MPNKVHLRRSEPDLRDNLWPSCDANPEPGQDFGPGLEGYTAPLSCAGRERADIGVPHIVRPLDISVYNPSGQDAGASDHLLHLAWTHILKGQSQGCLHLLALYCTHCSGLGNCGADDRGELWNTWGEVAVLDYTKRISGFDISGDVDIGRKTHVLGPQLGWTSEQRQLVNAKEIQLT